MEKKTRNLLLAGLLVVVVVAIVFNVGNKEPIALVEGADPVVGTGNVTVFLFEDYQCSHCQDYALGANYQHLIDTWVTPGHIRVAFKHVAFVGPYSESAAIASRCVAAVDNTAWPEWDHEVYAIQAQGGSPNPATLSALATKYDVAGDTYEACIADPEIKQQVADNYDAFVGAGASGTPTIVIGGVAYDPNDLAAVDQAIQEELA